MRALKGILLTGTAILALVACSSDKGPGEIGTLDDIVVRNAGEKAALPPPGAEPVKEVKIAESATTGDTAAPTAAEVIAAEDTGAPKQTVEQAAAAAQEAQEKAIAEAEQATAAATEEAAPATDAAVAWNQPRRIASPEEADKLVEEQMAQSAPPAPDAAAAPAPAEAAAAPAPAAEPAAPTATASATPQPLIPVTAPEDYKQDPNAPYSPAAARAAAAAQTGTPSDAPVTAPATATATTEAEPAAIALARPQGQMPLDPAVLQSKDPATIKGLQKTLKDAGFYKGSINGEMNSDTLNAYVKYQTAAQAAAAPAQAAAPAEAPAPAPTPVMEQPAAPAEAAPAPAPVAETAPAEAAAPASPRPLMVSRRTPEPLPAVAPTPAATPAPAATDAPPAAPAPAVQQAAPAPAPTPTAFPVTASPSDPAVITAVQKALAAKGLYSGAANGTVDTDTLNAIIRYQSSNNLKPGLLNTETLKSLGVVTE